MFSFVCQNVFSFGHGLFSVALHAGRFCVELSRIFRNTFIADNSSQCELCVILFNRPDFFPLCSILGLDLVLELGQVVGWEWD